MIMKHRAKSKKEILNFLHSGFSVEQIVAVGYDRHYTKQIAYEFEIDENHQSKKMFNLIKKHREPLTVGDLRKQIL